MARFSEVWSANHLPSSGRKESTIRQYRRFASYYILPHLGAIKLKDLTPLRVEGWTTAMRAAGLSGATARAAFNVLSAMMSTAQRDGLIRRNPCSVVARPAAGSGEARHFAPAQVQALIASSPSDFRPLVTLLAYTGLRIGEALALRWSDVDLGAGTLNVSGSMAATDEGIKRLEPKTARSARTVPLVSPVISGLKEQRRMQAEQRLALGAAWMDSDLVFTTTIGTPRDYRNELRRFQRLAPSQG